MDYSVTCTECGCTSRWFNFILPLGDVCLKCIVKKINPENLVAVMVTGSPFRNTLNVTLSSNMTMDFCGDRGNSEFHALFLMPVGEAKATVRCTDMLMKEREIERVELGYSAYWDGGPRFPTKFEHPNDPAVLNEHDGWFDYTPGEPLQAIFVDYGIVNVPISMDYDGQPCPPFCCSDNSIECSSTLCHRFRSKARYREQRKKYGLNAVHPLEMLAADTVLNLRWPLTWGSDVKSTYDGTYELLYVSTSVDSELTKVGIAAGRLESTLIFDPNERVVPILTYYTRHADAILSRFKQIHEHSLVFRRHHGKFSMYQIYGHTLCGELAAVIREIEGKS